MALKQVLLGGQPMAAGEEKRLLPGINVDAYDRLHFHISGGVRSIDDLSIKVLFGTPVPGAILLADSTVWFEETVSEREFVHEVPSNFGRTGVVLSVPVVAPLLYDVILKNKSAVAKPEI